MPTAEALPDATLATSFASFGNFNRTTLHFQILPRLSASFRYSSLQDFFGRNNTTLYDRSFDLRYHLLTETDRLPGVVVGLSDIIGTGVYSGEYLVATKTLMPGLKVTGGLGWGRFGSRDPFGTTGTRAAVTLGQGGVPTYDRWFRGNVAGFGGVSYAPNDRLNFKLEYSSDLYSREVTQGNASVSGPWNYGLDYKFAKGNGQFSVYHVLGEEVGAQLTYLLNPKTTGIPGGVEQSGLPVAVRPAGSAADLGWTVDTAQQTTARTQLAELLTKEGVVLESVQLEGRRAVARVSNPRFNAEAQLFGRVARAMTRTMPASVESFEIIPVVNGMPMSAVILNRTDLEQLEHAAAAEMLPRAQFTDAFRRTPAPDKGMYPQFDWSLAPYLQLSVFDPDSPVRADFGLRASASFEFTPNIILSGSVTQKLGGDLDKVQRQDKSNLPRVRTDHARYAAASKESIEYLQLAVYGRPGPNLYGRLTAGYLEEMYGGVSAELLWKPVGSRLAFGGEMNFIQRRDFDQLFGFQSMTTTDPVSGIRREIPELNGHLSAYYALGNGFHGQIDAGRYLAGDYGATISVDREFANGWRVGAYASFTNASFEDFGEGSFDKGIRFTIPLSTFLGKPSRRENDINIQSLSRDGGARLNVRGRLYEQVRDYHQPEVAKTWGSFWR